MFLINCVEMIRLQKLKPNAVDSLISIVGNAPRRSLSKLFDCIQTLIEGKHSDQDTWFRCLELLPIIVPLLDKPQIEDPEDDEPMEDYKSLTKDIILNIE